MGFSLFITLGQSYSTSLVFISAQHPLSLTSETRRVDKRIIAVFTGEIYLVSWFFSAPDVAPLSNFTSGTFSLNRFQNVFLNFTGYLMFKMIYTAQTLPQMIFRAIYSA